MYPETQSSFQLLKRGDYHHDNNDHHYSIDNQPISLSASICTCLSNQLRTTPFLQNILHMPDINPSEDKHVLHSFCCLKTSLSVFSLCPFQTLKICIHCSLSLSGNIWNKGGWALSQWSSAAAIKLTKINVTPGSDGVQTPRLS